MKNVSLELSTKSVFIVTLDNSFAERIKTILIDFPDFKYTSLKTMDAFLEIDTSSVAPYLLLVDGNLGQSAVQEWTQSLKMSYEKIPLIVFHSSHTPLDFASIKKNGADLLIHLNFDKEFIIDLILNVAPYEFSDLHLPLSALSSINSSDLDTEMETNFDLYIHLPFNKKTLLYRNKGSKLDDNKIKKIEKSDQHIYIKKTETKQFLEYARTAQTFANKENPVAETERALRTKKLIFEIMSDFFNQEATDFQGGRLIFDRCKEIVTEYGLLQEYSPEQAFAKITKFTGQERTFYNEAINLAVYASLFGQMLKLPMEKVESLALAGLLHNIGLSYVENFSLDQNIDSLSPTNKAAYFSYPEKSVLMIKTKRVPLPPDVADTIIEHRENLDGSGFPHKLNSDKIKLLSRVVRIAYEFQTMTALSKNENKRTASMALSELRKNVLEAKIPLDMNMTLELFKSGKV